MQLCSTGLMPLPLVEPAAVLLVQCRGRLQIKGLIRSNAWWLLLGWLLLISSLMQGLCVCALEPTFPWLGCFMLHPQQLVL